MTRSKLVFCFLSVASCWSHEPLCAQTETELLSVRSAMGAAPLRRDESVRCRALGELMISAGGCWA